MGSTRIETAAAIATATFSSARVGIVASDADFPDALAASYLAGRNAGPVLLTHPTFLPDATLSALRQLSISGVQVMGGPAAVSDNVVNQLRSDGFVTDRIAGSNRYGTAAAAAEAPGNNLVGSIPGKGRTALLTSGVNFPDSLSGGPMAYFRAFPLLLTDPSSLSPETSSALSSLAINHVIVLGGTAAVSATIDAQLASGGYTVERLQGVQRFETATAVADFELGTLGFKNVKAELARSDLYPDALAGAPHGGVDRAPILLTLPTVLADATNSWLRGHTSTVAAIDAFGGTVAISDATLAAAVRAAENA